MAVSEDPDASDTVKQLQRTIGELEKDVRNTGRHEVRAKDTNEKRAIHHQEVTEHLEAQLQSSQDGLQHTQDRLEHSEQDLRHMAGYFYQAQSNTLQVKCLAQG